MAEINTEKLSGLFNRILNQKTEQTDEATFKAYMKETFGKGTLPSQHELQQFNNVIVREAQILAQQKATDILSLLADVERVAEPAAFQYNIPAEFKAKWLWSADGVSVEHVRIEGKQVRYVTPKKYSTGMYYEVDSLSKGDVEHFRLLIDKAADALVELKFELITRLFRTAVAQNRIPLQNRLTGNNLTFEQYSKFASRFARFGGRPLFFADTALVDHFALQLAQTPVYQDLLVDERRKEYLEALNITTIGRTTAVNLVNPWLVNTIGTANESTVLPINEGYMFAGGMGYKPIKLVEFGGVTQYSEFDKDLKRVEVDMFVELGVDFLAGETVGYVKDDSITLV